MKRLAGLLAAGAAFACALAPDASAYLLLGGTTDSVSGSAVFGAQNNAVSVNASKGWNALDNTGTGTFTVQGVDTLGVHRFEAAVDCLSVDFSGLSAALLGHVVSAVGQPPTLYGTLVHFVDFDGQGNFSGSNDRIDVTTFNQNQYQRQVAAGCPVVAVPKQPLTSGNVVVIKGFGAGA